MYLITNVTGHNFHARQVQGRGYNKNGSAKLNGFLDGVNHFNPSSPIFDNRDAKYILLSDLGIAIAGAVLYWLGHTYGFENLLVWYFLPYLWVNHWLSEYIQPGYFSKNWWNSSRYYLPPTYGSQDTTLQRWRMDIHKRGRWNSRSGHWIYWTSLVSLRCSNTRGE